MRNLLFKNLTSSDKRRRIVASSEVLDNQGVHSIIRRHFICVIKEIKDTHTKRPSPYVYVFKERNSREKIEKFFCRIKGSIYAINNGRLFLILFTHSLKITLSAIAQDSLTP